MTKNFEFLALLGNFIMSEVNIMLIGAILCSV